MVFVVSNSIVRSHDAAVAHLRELPHSATASMPVEWSRKRFLDTLTATLRANPRRKGALPVAPGVWALVQPFGGFGRLRL